MRKSAAAKDADSDDKSSEYESSEEEDDAKSDPGDAEVPLEDRSLTGSLIRNVNYY